MITVSPRLLGWLIILSLLFWLAALTTIVPLVSRWIASIAELLP